MNSAQKFLLVLGIIFVLIASYFAYLQVQSTHNLAPKNETSDYSKSQFVTQGGNYSIQYPSGYEILRDEIPSTDGVNMDSPDTISINSKALASPNFIITIQYTKLEGDTSLEQMALSNQSCQLDMKSSEKYTLGGKEALIFKDTTCGPNGNTQILAINNETFYRITIVTPGTYGQVETNVNTVLSTFKFIQ